MKTRVAIVVGVCMLAIALWWWRRPPPAHEAAAPAHAPRAPVGPGGTRAEATAGEGAFALAVAYDDDPSGSLRLEGQVIDADDRPVAGATVTLTSNPRRTARSEADGSFVFERLVARAYTLAAIHGDAFAGPLTVRLTPKTEPVILKLAAAGSLEVTVVAQENRRPVAGAQVGLRDEVGVAGVTGADGKVVLRPLGPGRHLVDAGADGFAPAAAGVMASGRGGAVQKRTIELARGAGVSGTVVDAAGKPVAGALVRSVAMSRVFQLPAARRGGASDVSDAAGRWSLAAVPAGTFRFAATHEQHGPGTSEPVTLDGKTPREAIVVTLEPGAHIAGQVVLPDGTPVPSASVRVIAREPGQGRGGGFAAQRLLGEPPRQAFADEHGKFDIGGLPRRQAVLIAGGETASSDAMQLDLAAKPEQVGLTVVLDVDGEIAGTVVDAQGQPVSGAQVTAGPAFGGVRRGGGGAGGGGFAALRLRGPVADMSDSGGRFRLRGLADGSYRLVASRGGAAATVPPGRQNGVDARVGDTDVRLVLLEDGRIKGKVLFADGSTPATFTVSIGFGVDESFGGGDGAFEVVAPAGPASLSVSGPEFLGKAVPDVNVRPDDTVDVGTISVDRGRQITGVVVGSDGTPVVGATVYAGVQLIGNGEGFAGGGGGGFGGGGAAIQTTTSGDDGSYLIAAAGDKSLLVAADHPTAGRSQIARVPAAPTSVEVDLTLQIPGSLDGRVTSGGQPMANAMVTAAPQSAALGTFSVRTAGDGTYRFDKLTPDSYVVSASQAGGFRGNIQTQTVTIAPQQAAHLDINLTVGSVTVSLGIAPPPGSNVHSAQVSLLSGSVQATTANQLIDAAAARGDGSAHMGYVFGGVAASLPSVTPGAYTACAVPIPIDLGGPRDLAQIRDKRDQLICVCVPVTIADSPDNQSVTVQVPVPPRLL
jgi:hypothetical protein